MLKYKVIKPIAATDAWETGANVDDILTVEKWEGELTLMNNGKAVCDIDSVLANEHCCPIKN